jgi:hypothetical protein
MSDTWRSRSDAPECVIDALKDWLNMVGTWHPMYDIVQHWVEGDPTETKETEEFHYFTFGYDHKHPITGESLEKCYIKVRGDSETSRAAMLENFGRNWAIQYGSMEAMTRNGSRELKEITYP